MASLPSYARPFSKCFLSPRTQQDTERDEQIYNSYEKLTSQLSIHHDWIPICLSHHQSFWINTSTIPSSMAIQSHFNPLLVTNPKSSTTRLKALSYATLHRHSFSLISDHPLLIHTPHQCVPSLENLLLRHHP
ncbi:hypothetical protein DsansV1_C07g0070001 [Dioscorea sansibarensis]